MSLLNESGIQQIIGEVTSDAEYNRRAESLRRHTIYKDGGKQFLIEAIEREFNKDAVKEMRLAPLNVIKKVIDKRSQVYKRPPLRTTENESDKALMDWYSQDLMLNVNMQWFNRFYNLFANTAMYIIPTKSGLKIKNVPPYLFSLLASPKDPENVEGFIFSSFDASRAAPRRDPGAPTGVQNFTTNQSYATGKKDRVGSNELRLAEGQELIIWTDTEHFTVNDEGQIMQDPNKGPEQFQNPLGTVPVVFASKSRHNQTWSTVGSDLPDLAMTIQQAWSDLLTIAKHQGYSLLTFTGKEPPEKLTMGINRAIFMKQDEDGVAPTISYVTASSRLSEYKELIMELLSTLLTTYDLNPNSIGGSVSLNQATSGFHALIQNADTLEAVEADKPVMLYSEQELWYKLAAYHNYLFDSQDPRLNPEARLLGKFSEDFKPQIRYHDAKPLESEQEVIENVSKLRADGLMSRRQALQRLYSDLDAEAVEQLLEEIDNERVESATNMMSRFQEPALEV
jgi:hypothetical protein